MISLTRLNGERIAVNPDLLERAEETPDTVLTLTNGTKYVVHETLDELIERVQHYRAGTWVLAQRWADDPDAVSHVRLHLVPDAGKVTFLPEGHEPVSDGHEPAAASAAVVGEDGTEPAAPRASGHQPAGHQPSGHQS